MVAEEDRATTMPQRHRKLVIVGDGGCGKTCMLLAFAENRLPDAYVPTVYETYTKQFVLGKYDYHLSLYDTAGQDVYDRLRPLTYPESDAVIVCYSADSPDSFYNAQDKWIPEIRHFCPNTPLVMVCTKVDLRDDAYTRAKLAKVRQEPVSCAEGLKVARLSGAASYVECSALSHLNITDVFEEATRATNSKYKNKKLKKKMNQCTYV